MRSEASPSKMTVVARSLACVALLAALLPGLSSSWMASNGGEAERVWSFGIPGSPVLTISRHGVGPLNDLAWSSPEISFNPASASFPLLLVASATLLVLALRRRSAARLGCEA